MDAALRGQHSITPPLVVAANITPATGGVVSTLASAPSAGEAVEPPKKRPRGSEGILKFLQDQAEREEEREKEAVAREETRERAATARAERYLSLFEKMVDKL